MIGKGQFRALLDNSLSRTGRTKWENDTKSIFRYFHALKASLLAISPFDCLDSDVSSFPSLPLTVTVQIQAYKPHHLLRHETSSTSSSSTYNSLSLSLSPPSLPPPPWILTRYCYVHFFDFIEPDRLCLTLAN